MKTHCRICEAACVLVAAIVLIFAAAGCDDEQPSCLLTNTAGERMACLEYSEAAGNSAKGDCEDQGGDWQGHPCEEEGAVARCVSLAGRVVYFQAYLDDVGTTLDALRMVCEQTDGEFTEL